MVVLTKNNFNISNHFFNKALITTLPLLLFLIVIGSVVIIGRFFVPK